jgi:chromosome segregation ATPase
VMVILPLWNGEEEVADACLACTQVSTLKEEGVARAAEAESALVQATLRSAQLEEATNQAKQDAEASRGSIATLEQQLAATKSELGETAGELTSVQQAAAGTAAELATSRAKVSELESGMSVAQQRADEISAVLLTVRTELADTRAALAAAEQLAAERGSDAEDRAAVVNHLEEQLAKVSVPCMLWPRRRTNSEVRMLLVHQLQSHLYSRPRLRMQIVAMVISPTFQGQATL